MMRCRFARIQSLRTQKRAIGADRRRTRARRLNTVRGSAVNTRATEAQAQTWAQAQAQTQTQTQAQAQAQADAQARIVRSAASTTFVMSRATVMGPTPPGFGESQPATSSTPGAMSP